MSRIRTIKPEFWTDETVGECSPTSRLLLIASLNFADDYGNLDRSSKQLKAQAFPYDNVDCEPMVLELVRARLLIEYEHDGRRYLHIRGFSKHQRVEKPGKPRFPPYTESANAPLPVAEPSPNSRGVLTEELRSLREGKGREKEGNTQSHASTTTSRAREAPRGAKRVFEKLKSTYPPGTYAAADWLTAEHYVNVRLETDATETELVASCAEFRLQQDALGRTGSQFVLSPAKFWQNGKWRGPFPLPQNAEAKKSEAEELWPQVRAAVQAGEGSKRFPADTRVSQAIGIMGGWQSLGQRRSDRADFTKREFVEAYESVGQA